MNTQVHIDRFLSATLGCAFLLSVATAQSNPRNVSAVTDLVEFFKTAVSSPPDVDYFVGSQRRLRERKLPPEIRKRLQGLTNQPPMFYEGARSGSNYFLRSTGWSNPLDSGVDATVVVGRAGSETYHFNPNTVTYTLDRAETTSPDHTLLSLSGTYYSMVRQFLNMGLADIRTDSVKWDIDEFTALRDDGGRVYGHMELSKGMPYRLSIAANKGERPYRSYTYVYPVPATALGGFPSSITAAATFQDGMHPTVEYSILSVRLSEQTPAESVFSKSRFLGSHIQHTNVFEGGVLLNFVDGKLIKDLKQPVVEGPERTPKYRALSNFCVLAVILLPIVIIVLTKVKQTRTTTNQIT